MKIGKLILLGTFVLGASVSASAATLPRLHAPGVTTPATFWVKDEEKKKKKHHAHAAHKAHKHKVAHAHPKKLKKIKKA